LESSLVDFLIDENIRAIDSRNKFKRSYLVSGSIFENQIALERIFSELFLQIVSSTLHAPIKYFAEIGVADFDDPFVAFFRYKL
jgi:hypothetical protein